MHDDLTRRAIIAAHDAQCVCVSKDQHDDYAEYRGLTVAERAIVEALRADREAADSPQRLFGRLIATAKGRQILDENGVHGVERAERAEAAIERARAVHRERTANTGPVERCVCIGCEMARALDGTEATS